MNKWYESKSNNDAVLSTRIRFARNLEDFPFPCRLDEQGRQKVCQTVRDALSDVSGLKLHYIEMNPLCCGFVYPAGISDLGNSLKDILSALILLHPTKAEHCFCQKMNLSALCFAKKTISEYR